MEDWSELVLPEDLRRQTTLEAYLANDLAQPGPHTSPDTAAYIRRRSEEIKSELEELARPGDSWWEWIQGDEPLMQSGGLALVRDGKIVWATQMWIS